MDKQDLKDFYSESRVFSRRAAVFLFFLFCLTMLLVARMFYLQIVNFDRYTTLSEKNRLLLQPIGPNRGLIYDVNGVLLAENRASHSLNLTVEHIEDVQQTIDQLAGIVNITPRNLENFSKRMRQHRRPFQSVPIKYHLTEEEIARIAVNTHRLPGISIEAQLVRNYTQADLTAHVLGYVGRINEKELKRIDPANYSGTTSIGKTGIEKYYEDQLHGHVGFRKVEINARGRVLKVLEKAAPLPGNDISLYLDVNLQRVAVEALGEQRGAVVALDTETGGVLALVSTPAFDPNLFVTGIDSKSYASLRDSANLPLFNRALRGQYPPGSTLKPFVALAGLDNGYTDWQHTIFDPGWYQLTKEGRYYRDWKKWGHGRVNLETAIIRSCDTYFYEMAHHMDIDQMHGLLMQFGFGRNTSLDLAEGRRGVLPSSVWKKNTLGESWYTGDSLNFSIGQGFALTTPLQLATATAVLANRGRWVQPRLIKGLGDEDVAVDDNVNGIAKFNRDIPEDVVLRDQQNWERMIHAMQQVVHGLHGTARGIGKGITYQMAGKTGTAQVIGIKQDEEYDEENIAERNKDHGLFIAFAPVEQPKVAIAVIVENGGGGSTSAAPVARKVLDAYFDGQSSGDNRS